jgi:hypothetical protein
MDLQGDELIAAQKAAADLKDSAGNQTHAHAKRFEKVVTAAGEIVLCNATRQQVRAVDMSLDVNVKLGQLNAAREGLFVAMCVLPGPSAAKAAIEDWPELIKDEELSAAMSRLNGARSK